MYAGKSTYGSVRLSYMYIGNNRVNKWERLTQWSNKFYKVTTKRKIIIIGEAVKLSMVNIA